MSKRHMNRRKFLKTAAGTTAVTALFPYVIPSSALGKADTVAPSNRINMGCIGLGGQGTWDMLGFAKYPDVQFVALCDVNAGSDDYDMLYQFPGTTAGLAMGKKRLLEHPNVKNKNADIGMYHDFRDLLARSDIDAVLVTTPDHWHGLVSIAAAEAGKDIYCEKPLVNTIAEGRAVCDAVSRYGRVFQTGSHERSNDSVRYACELVHNGRIGKLHTIRVNMPNSDKH
ncbi:MAG: Gfo/Idh/MocA family protein, partial [Planctomycetota bacterium]